VSGADRYAVAVAAFMLRRFGLEVVLVPTLDGKATVMRADGVAFTEREANGLRNWTKGWRLVRGGPA